MNSRITKVVSVYYDRSGDEPGWVARCTEYDERGPILGRIAMDEPIDYAENAQEAREFAAEYWGVDVEDVRISR